MKPIPTGQFIMGSVQHYPEERPAHERSVSAFEMDSTTVTNADFEKFVTETGYLTTAEIPLDPASAPGMPPDYFTAGSLVFHMTDGPVNLKDVRNWWSFIQGANWKQPEGPGSSIAGRENHPVVQVSFYDAQAYAYWAGKALPTEVEWEFAAKDGVKTLYPWGEELDDAEFQVNTWHGEFPWKNEAIAPFSWPANAGIKSRYGLYNMIGNVWEWTADAFYSQHEPNKRCCTPSSGAVEGQLFVVKGGSFLCAPSYCRRYRASARSPQESRSSTNHLGFRCVRRS